MYESNQKMTAQLSEILCPLRKKICALCFCDGVMALVDKRRATEAIYLDCK